MLANAHRLDNLPAKRCTPKIPKMATTTTRKIITSKTIAIDDRVVDTKIRNAGKPAIERSGRIALMPRTAVTPPPDCPAANMISEIHPPTTTAKSNILHPPRKYTSLSGGPNRKFFATTLTKNSIVNIAVKANSADSNPLFHELSRPSNGLYNANVAQFAIIVPKIMRSNHIHSHSRFAFLRTPPDGEKMYSDTLFKFASNHHLLNNA